MGIGSDKIITTLRERQQIKSNIAGLLQVTSEGEIHRRAQHIAASGRQVIPVILNNLDRSNPQMLKAVGLVSSLYPDRDEMVAGLYQTAADKGKPDHCRVAAMLILERYLNIEPDPALIETLHDPQTMVVQSIDEMLHESESHPLALLDYVADLAPQPADVLDDVIDNLVQIGRARAVPMLCLLAQEPDTELAAMAIHALGRINHRDAARGLASLLPMLPLTTSALAERSLRKLQFKGIAAPPPADMDKRWRALVSPIDGHGNQVVWFIRANAPADGRADHCLFIGAAIAEGQGIVQAYGGYAAPAQSVPPRQPSGYIHSVYVQNDIMLYMLETDFDYGRWLVKQGQAQNAKLLTPLPVEYRLMGQLLWQYPAVEIEMTRRQRSNALELLDETGNLLVHPAFNQWFVDEDHVIQHTLSLIQQSPSAIEQNLGTWAGKLAQAYFDHEQVHRLSARLAAVAEWLLRAKQAHLAQVAFAAADTITTVAPDRHPFTLRMAERGLEVIIQQLHKQYSLGLDV